MFQRVVTSVWIAVFGIIFSMQSIQSTSATLSVLHQSYNKGFALLRGFTITSINVRFIHNVTFTFLVFLIYWLDFLVCVYNHKLQINFDIRSCWMIFCQLTVVGFWNLATYVDVTTFFTMIWDIDLIFGMWVYWWVTDQVLISFRLNDFGIIYAPWTINVGQIFSCHHALRYWLDFWYLEL
jgi:hypothetical protein